MIDSKKTRKALLGTALIGLVGALATIARNNDIHVAPEVVAAVVVAIGALFGLDIIGHFVTDAAAAKRGDSDGQADDGAGNIGIGG